jgi:hypothetical protein
LIPIIASIFWIFQNSRIVGSESEIFAVILCHRFMKNSICDSCHCGHFASLAVFQIYHALLTAHRQILQPLSQVNLKRMLSTIVSC